MTIQINCRLHTTGYVNPMAGWFTKEYGGTWFRGESSMAGMGRLYMFFVVPRAWIHGKYLRWRWAAYPGGTARSHVEVWDGSYERSSLVDFPDGSGPVSKGNGMLQELANRGPTFSALTDDVQIDTSGGNQSDVTIIFWTNDAWSGNYALFELDWIEVNDSAGGADNLYFEPFDPASYISEAGGSNGYGYISGGNVPEWTLDLSCSFHIRNSEDLKGIFTTRQWREELLAGFTSKQWQEDLLGGFISQQAAIFDFPAEFAVQRTATPLELLGGFSTGGSGNVYAKARVEKYYNLEGTGGIAFYWWGANNPPEAMNQLILETATGFWYTDFYDGVAAWRLVEIPWGSFIWDAAPQRFLEPHRHGFDEPNQQQISGFIWTVHTHGERRLDYIYAYPRVPTSDLLGYFAIQRTATPVELLAGFSVVQTGTPQELLAGFEIRRSASEELLAGFEVGQEVRNLSAKFNVGVGSADLLGQIAILSPLSIREHKRSSNNPAWVYTKPSASILRGDSNDPSLGTSNWFFNVPRQWIHGKYIRVTWRAAASWGSWSHAVRIYDGAYNRASMVDFPSGSAMITKGNGVLQTGLIHTGTFAEVTEEFQVDVSGGSEAFVMILVVSSDSWTSQDGWIYIDTIEINDSPGGVGTLWRETFTGPIVMEVTGTLNDYGYISRARGSQSLAAGFDIAP